VVQWSKSGRRSTFLYEARLAPVYLASARSPEPPHDDHPVDGPHACLARPELTGNPVLHALKNGRVRKASLLGGEPSATCCNRGHSRSRLEKFPLTAKVSAVQHVTMRHVITDDKPLSEPVVLILTSLAAEPTHGYALLKDVEQLSGGRVQLSTGTLYGAIRRLLENGWIERFEQRDTSRDKQAYRVTARGRAQLHAEIARLRQLVQATAARLRLREV
jgi:DNA-binding PadR family transcriptional regulator